MFFWTFPTGGPGSSFVERVDVQQLSGDPDMLDRHGWPNGRGRTAVLVARNNMLVGEFANKG